MNEGSDGPSLRTADGPARPAPAGRYEVVLSRTASRYHTEAAILDSAAASPLDLTAFVSCYNESELIIGTLDDVRTALEALPIRFEIVVIDDCSQDGSAALVERYIAEHPETSIILRRNLMNQGLAQNYVDGAFIGKGRYYKLFCGDNTEPVDSIRRICSLIGKADMIIPSYSYVEGKSTPRLLLSRLYTALVNLISGHRLKYYNGLAVHLRHNVMRWHPNTRGFGFQADIICMLLDRGATHTEVSVPAVDHGVSRALSTHNVLSVANTLVDLMIRRIGSRIFRR
jgi:glycosyltransferase involved in cell wall biosynthesis